MSLRFGIIVVASALAAVPATARAQDGTRRVTLDEALNLFVSQNLELRIARANAAELSGTAHQAAAYPNPGVTASYERLANGPLGYRETYLTLTQRLDWPWLAAARRSAANRRADAGAARVSADSVKLAFDVRRTFIETAQAEQAHTALLEATEMVRTAERQATDRAAAGDIAGYELRRLRVERLRYENELSVATLRMRAARRRLAGLILPGDTLEMAAAGPIDGRPGSVPLEGALRASRLAHGDLAEVQAIAASARDSRRAAGADRLPVPIIAAGYKTQADGFGGTYLSAGFSVPLFDRRGAAVAAADAHARGAEARVDLVRRQVENEVRRTHETFAAATARIDLFGDGATAEIEALLRIARVSYAEGEMTLVELLDAVNVFRAGRLAVAEAWADLWTSFFDLERAVGRTLTDVSSGEEQ